MSHELQNVQPVQANSSEAMSAALAVCELGEIQAQVQMARAFPRDEEGARKKVMVACKRPRFADAALYAFKRGNKTISDLSVHAAREMARCWGNIQVDGCLVLPSDPEYVHIEISVRDNESGAVQRLQDRFLKRHFRKNKNGEGGQWVTPDERDLRELVLRRAALLERNCILKLMPPDFRDEVRMACSERAVEDVRTETKNDPSAVIKKMEDHFKAIGVERATLERYVGSPIADCPAELVAELRHVYKSIVDGNSTIEEHFGEQAQTHEASGSPVDNLKAKLKEDEPWPATEPGSRG